jgi:hypothetical protein
MLPGKSVPEAADPTAGPSNRCDPCVVDERWAAVAEAEDEAEDEDEDGVVGSPRSRCTIAAAAPALTPVPVPVSVEGSIHRDSLVDGLYLLMWCVLCACE